MSNIKTIESNNSWIITNDKDTDKVGSIVKTGTNQFEVKYQGLNKFYTKSQLLKNFGQQLFSQKNIIKRLAPKNMLHEFPTDQEHYNGMFDVKRKVPIYTKSKKSKSFFCAGNYIIKFHKGWIVSFCPKLISLEKYKFYGPFISSQKTIAFKKKFID